MKQSTPDTLRLSAGGTLRFALGSADGPRSNIWTVFGSKNTGDIYVGARDRLPMAKLSLHESGRWRRALTSQEAARQNLPDDVDRVMNRWEVPEPIADGWVHAVSIAIPSSSIQTDPGPLKRRGRVQSVFTRLSQGLVRSVSMFSLRVPVRPSSGSRKYMHKWDASSCPVAVAYGYS